jgi:hypothetical protein
MRSYVCKPAARSVFCFRGSGQRTVALSRPWATGIHRGAHWLSLPVRNRLGESLLLAQRMQKYAMAFTLALVGCSSARHRQKAVRDAVCKVRLSPCCHLIALTCCVLAVFLWMLKPGLSSCTPCIVVGAWLSCVCLGDGWIWLLPCPGMVFVSAAGPGDTHACRSPCLAVRYVTHSPCGTQGLAHVILGRAFARQCAKVFERPRSMLVFR